MSYKSEELFRSLFQKRRASAAFRGIRPEENYASPRLSRLGSHPLGRHRFFLPKRLTCQTLTFVGSERIIVLSNTD